MHSENAAWRASPLSFDSEGTDIRTVHKFSIEYIQI